MFDKLLEQAIEKEEWLPNVNAHLDGALDEGPLLILKVINNFVLGLAHFLHPQSHGLPLLDQFVNQVHYKQLELSFHRLLAHMAVICDSFEAFDFAFKDIKSLLESINPSAVHVLLALINILLPSHVLDRAEP